MHAIDLRSDTVTRPTPAMLEAMHAADVGDDVLEGDPTVRRLEARTAEILGKEAAMFVPSGTMANLCAIRTHCRPGDEIMVHKEGHVHLYEAGGYASAAGASLMLIDTPDGRFTPEQFETHLRDPNDDHYPLSRLLIVENTHNHGGGVVWPMDRLGAVAQRAHAHGVSVHMDGARLWNAAEKLGVEPAAIAANADSVSVCFSKGLGAPVGSALAGDGEFIRRARRHRKALGGAMRQAGGIAAGALFALEHNRARLSEDREHAVLLARLIDGAPGLAVERERVETNMVFWTLSAGLLARYRTAYAYAAELERRGVRTLDAGIGRLRAVCHLHITRGDVERAAAIIRELAEHDAAR